MAISDTKIIAYVADTSDVKRKLRSLERLNKKIGGAVGKDFSSGLKKVGKSLNEISTTKITKGFQDIANTSSKTTSTLKGVNGSLLRVTETTKVNAKGVRSSSTAYKELSTNTVSLGENMKRLAKRAALTIPLWLVLRGAMLGVSRTMKDGLANIAKFDKVLQKARRNMQGSATQITSDFKRLREEATQLSLETGVAAEDIVTAFQRFATTGQNFETSMAGARASTSLAIAQFGETVDVANALAISFKLLGHTIEGAATEEEKMMKITALTDELWKTNAFDIDEMGKAVERFAGIANVMGISMEDTIKLMATMHTGALKGKQGARLLSTALIKMTANLDEVASELGISFNPKVDKAKDVILKVVEAIAKLKGSGDLKGISEMSEKLKNLLGIRGTLPISTIASTFEVLQENMAVTGDIDNFNQAVKDVTETTGQLADRFSNANKEIGKALVTGIVGGESFDDSLKTIVETLTAMQSKAQAFGAVWRRDLLRTVTAGGLGLPLAELAEKIIKAKDATEDLRREIDKGLGGKLNISELAALLIQLSSTEIDIPNLDAIISEITKRFGKAADSIRSQMNKAVEGGLTKEDLNKLLKDLEGVDANLLNIDEDTLDAFKTGVKKALEEVEKLADEAKRKNLKIPIGVDISIPDLSKVSNAIIESNLEQLKAQGALASEILDRKTALEQLYNINQDAVTLVERQLLKERELTKEKRLQTEIGNESLKLFKIAKENGTETARKIADVLSGERDLSQFLKAGGEEAEIFKKEFGDILEQQQAKAFFRGDIGELNKTRGGQRINIQESAIRGVDPLSPDSRSRLGFKTQRSGLLREHFGSQQTVNQTVQNNVQAPITVKVEIDASKLKALQKIIIDKVAAELPKIGTSINAGLTGALYGKQASSI